MSLNTISSISSWSRLRRWRWPGALGIGLSFALIQLIEALVWPHTLGGKWMWLDILLWGGLGGIAVWMVVTWLMNIEQRHQDQLATALAAQTALNERLQRTNSQLALLSSVNQQIADSATLDDILDIALTFPLRLVPAQNATLWLLEGDGSPVVTRRVGDEPPNPPVVTGPVREGVFSLALRHDQTLLGWMEFHAPQKLSFAPDEAMLLETIAGELAEAIVGARRRSREERAIYELERAIAEERARIARDIHDGIAQTLAFRRMRVDLWLDWIKDEPDHLYTELVELKATLRDQIAELRRAIFALRPVQFDQLGFVGGLHKYITDFAEQQNWTAQVDLVAIPAHLPPHLEAVCFRVIQESLTNAAKHAAASRVTVETTISDSNELELAVTDNGGGFTLPAAPDSTQLGLRQLQERVAGVGGRVAITTAPGAGTQIRVALPLR